MSTHVRQDNDQIYKVVASIDYQIQQQIKGQMRDLQLMQTKETVKQQQASKDVVIPAALCGEAATSARGSRAASQAPVLPWPKFPFGSNANQPGLIAIIGAVLAEQVKTNSNFWSTMWKQASEAMQAEVSFAPIIGDAVKASWDAQSDATLQQANQNQTDGEINIAMFAGSVLMGGVSEGMNPENKLAGGAPQLEQESQDGINSAEQDAENNTNNANVNNLDGNNPAANPEEELTDTDEQVVQNNNTNANRTRAAGKAIGTKSSSLTKRIYQFMSNVAGKAAMMDQLSRGITQLNDHGYQAKQAADQSAAGAQEALSKEAEQYAQFEGQSFTKNYDLTAAAQQYIDYACNIWKSAADTISQTIRSMFSNV